MYSITKSNDTVYETDSVAGKVKDIMKLHDGSLHSLTFEHTIEEKLSQVKQLSIVPIRNIDDVCAALKDRDTLAKVLEQGLEEEHLPEKEFIVKLFMRIKDKIKKEDMTIRPHSS